MEEAKDSKRKKSKLMGSLLMEKAGIWGVKVEEEDRRIRTQNCLGLKWLELGEQGIVAKEGSFAFAASSTESQGFRKKEVRRVQSTGQP